MWGRSRERSGSGNRPSSARDDERDSLLRSRGGKLTSGGAIADDGGATATTAPANPAEPSGPPPQRKSIGSGNRRGSADLRSPNNSFVRFLRSRSTSGSTSKSPHAERRISGGDRGRSVTSGRLSTLPGLVSVERRARLGSGERWERPGMMMNDDVTVGAENTPRENKSLIEAASTEMTDSVGKGLDGKGRPKRKSKILTDEEKEEALTKAATFLEDALNYREPDYYTDSRSMRIYRLRQGRVWKACTVIAVVAYIAACFLGKPPFSADWSGMPAPTALQGPVGQMWGLCLECGCVLFFAFDIYLLYRCNGVESIVRRWWRMAFVLSLFLSATDLTTRWYTHRPWSRVFRPAVFFFVGPKVRDCSLSTLHAVGALLPVLVLELLVTLVYACVCVVLYHGVSEAPFTTLGDAFMSLFALSTTVNDPDVWMILYHRNRANVLVFSSFLVVQVFFLHNILLASVWNEFGGRMKVYARHKRKWREESVRRAFDALDASGAGYLQRETVMNLLTKIRPHYDGGKRRMMYERMVQSAGKSRAGGKAFDAGEVTQVYRRNFCDNVVEALSLQIRTMRALKIASMGQYMLMPLYVWNMGFVVVTCAMSPWIFNTSMFWFALIPTSLFLGASVLVELLMTGFRAYMFYPWNRVKSTSLCLTLVGLCWFLVFTAPGEWGNVFNDGKRGSANVHMQVSIGLLMSARCIDLGTLLRLVPAIHDVVSTMYRVTPSVFAQAGVIFTIFHLYAYLGMALYAGVVVPNADFGDTPFANSPYYYDNNFNSYPQGLVTLFELLIVNNWNMIITGYTHVSPLGMWAYMYFLSFITLAVALALNVLTAIFMTAFTATTIKTTSIKANLPNARGATGNISQSVTSNVARTALGAGVSVALRPSAFSYADSEVGSSWENSSPRARSTHHEEDMDIPGMARDNSNGSSSKSLNAGTDIGGGGGGGILSGVGSWVERSFMGHKRKGSDMAKSNSEGRASGGALAEQAGGQVAPPPPSPPPPATSAPIATARSGLTSTSPLPVPTARVGDKSRMTLPSPLKPTAEQLMPPPMPQLPSTLVSASSSSLGVRDSLWRNDPMRLRLSARAVLPEHEAVEKVGDQPPDMRDMRQDSYLGWGSGVGDAGMPPPPPVGAEGGARGRAISGNTYKVSRRNSYSDKDIFEAGMMGDDDDDVAGKVLGAISMGLGNTIGIRACMLRPKEASTRNPRLKSSSPRAADGVESSAEDEIFRALYGTERTARQSIATAKSFYMFYPSSILRDDEDAHEDVEQPETYLVFENRGFRDMVAPYLDMEGQALGVELGAREDEGWEAMAMRDGLTDAMLHEKFGEVISSECPPPPESPGVLGSRSGGKDPLSSSKTSQAPPSPSHRDAEASASPERDGQEDEGDDGDGPKDLGVKIWTKDLGKKGETVLSIQCVLAVRRPLPVVVYTARVLR